MDLLNDQRSLIHTGKLWDKGRDGWAELFVMLFDNYCQFFSSTFINSVLTSNSSGFDEAEKRQRYHEVSCLPKGLSQHIHIWSSD